MLIAIHHRDGSFSEQWIEYCVQNKVPHKIVNAYDSDIIQQLADCDGFMWHWLHNDPKAILFARQLIYSIEMMGINVFPSAKTCWHFDDKVGQKYLLEAIGAPLVPSYVFYDKQTALEWVNKTIFPKVFKLRGGAGSQNVQLVSDKANAIKLVKKAFSTGFPVQRVFTDTKNKVRQGIRKGTLSQKIFRAPKTITNIIKNVRARSKEKGYVYFQEFIPGNAHDTRVIVIGQRGFAIKRMCRVGDFRASGSGSILYNRDQIDEQCVRISFNVTAKLGAQCIALDFVFDPIGAPLIVEISYGFSREGYLDCPGYWDRDLNWHEGLFSAQNFMMEEFTQNIQEGRP